METQTETWTAQKILEALNARAQELRAMGARKLGLFGSYRHNAAAFDSDMDFLVVLERPSFDDYMEIKFFLEDLFGCKADLVLETNLKSRLRSRILEEVVYVQGL